MPTTATIAIIASPMTGPMPSFTLKGQVERLDIWMDIINPVLPRASALNFLLGASAIRRCALPQECLKTDE
jgi:hypothetical protein